ncbi:hypothetical protein C8R43DRAFT_1133165 [Mycena crocata]|nr:hypothetical protein C8R43DRAFT_1133165 [Mycena crocata]
MSSSSTSSRDSEHSAISAPPVRRSVSPPQPQYYCYSYDLFSRGYHGGYIHPPPPPQAEYANYVPYPQYVSEPQTFVIPYGGCATYPSPANVNPANTVALAAASQPAAPIHTDDASMKSSDILRRRCFNCCTTETATWRRSKLSAGKLVRPQLCNKCGIFERTHSRPRPEQLSYKHHRISKQPPSSSPPQLLTLRIQSTYESNQLNPPYPTYSVPSGPQYHAQLAAHPPFLLPRPPHPQNQDGTANTTSTRPSSVTMSSHNDSDKPSHNFDTGNPGGKSAYREEEPTHTVRSNSRPQSRHAYGNTECGAEREGAQSAHPVNST